MKKEMMWALTPVLFLLVAVLATLGVFGSDVVAEFSWAILLMASLVALAIGYFRTRASHHHLLRGIVSSARQTMPAIPMLLLIGAVSAVWMASGVVPLLISVGMRFIYPELFLAIAAMVCAVISILTGSSWTTIATIGVAFMGIGQMLGFSSGWIAGAIISGAYFGDKISPLSDTTVLASSSAGVDLFTHIRYMLITTIPSLLIALGVYCIAGHMADLTSAVRQSDMAGALEATFNLNPWIFVIPVVTLVMIALRLNTLLTLSLSTLLGLVGVFVFQPHIAVQLGSGVAAPWAPVAGAARLIFTSTSIPTGDPALDSLVATGGMAAMMPTVLLVVSAMLFGGIMMGTGLLRCLTGGFSTMIRTRVSAVSLTAGSGLFLNCATADQYLSLIIGGNMYRTLYQRLGLEARLLSRTMEDSVSVTSVLIPWNSCGMTQSSVLGVATLAYLPYCVFNYLSPLMSVLIALTGFRIRQTSKVGAAKYAAVRVSVSEPDRK